MMQYGLFVMATHAELSQAFRGLPGRPPRHDPGGLTVRPLSLPYGLCIAQGPARQSHSDMPELDASGAATPQ